VIAGGRRLAALSAAVMVVALLAACGSSSSSSSTASASSVSSSASSSSASSSAAASSSSPGVETGTATIPGTTTSASSSGTATGPAAAASALASCRSGTTTVSAGRGTGGLGHVGITLLFHNRGGSRCVLFGYPGVDLVSASGRQVQAARTRSGYLGGLSSPTTTVPVIRMAPGQTVSALLEGDDVPSGGGTCPGYAALLVTPPNETSTERLTRSLSAVCSPQIHPVVTGVTGSER